MPRSQVIALLVFLLVLSSLISLSTAALPPKARADICEESGGTWNGGCVCPPQATSLWNSCWLVTPKEACKRLGGRIGRERGLLGPAGCSFRCKRGGEDITGLARDRAVKYSEGKVKPKRPNWSDQPLPPHEKVKTEFVGWPVLVAVGLGLLITIGLYKWTS